MDKDDFFSLPSFTCFANILYSCRKVSNPTDFSNFSKTPSKSDVLLSNNTVGVISEVSVLEGLVTHKNYSFAPCINLMKGIGDVCIRDIGCGRQ